MATDEFYQSREWLELRYQAIKRYGGMCQCCGERGTPDNPIQVDHIKPRSKFPELALDITNTQVLCRNCNAGKGASDRTDWRKEVIPKKNFVPWRNQTWTAYRKAMECCQYISRHGLCNGKEAYVNRVLTPLIGMTKDSNEENRITKEEALECFIASLQHSKETLDEENIKAINDLWDETYSTHCSKASIGSLIWICKEAGMTMPWSASVIWEDDYSKMTEELEKLKAALLPQGG